MSNLLQILMWYLLQILMWYLLQILMWYLLQILMSHLLQIFMYLLQILMSYILSRVFTNSPEDWGSIQGRIILKTQKMVLDATLLNTQHYKIRIKDKVEQSKEWSSVLPYTLV